jgi:hypothetical protein
MSEKVDILVRCVRELVVEMSWSKTYGFSVESVGDLQEFKRYLEETAVSETLNVGRHINELVDTDWKSVQVCLEDELLVYYRLCEECGELGRQGVSNRSPIDLRCVVCKKCGHCLVVKDPRQTMEQDDEALYILAELNEINNNPTDY